MCGNSSGIEILRKQIKHGENQTYQETQWILGGKKKGMVVKGVRMLHLRHEGDASEMVANSGDMKAWGASRFSLGDNLYISISFVINYFTFSDNVISRFRYIVKKSSRQSCQRTVKAFLS